MKLPNFASVAVLMGLVVFLETLAAGADQLVPTLWVPVVVLLLTAAAKAVEVYRTSQAGDVRTMDAPSPMRRWLLE